MNSVISVGCALCLLAAILTLARRSTVSARACLVIGCAAIIVAVVAILPQATPSVDLPFGLPTTPTSFRLDPTALWLLGFGLLAAGVAAWVGTPSEHKRQWTFGLAMSLIGATGVFGVQDAVSFLVAWEIMSLGGALMILGERLSRDDGRGTLFMLALLEVGTVAVLIAFLLLASAAQSISFADFATAAAQMPLGEQLAIGLLLLIGFGAKIGLLPFYEWFPSAYGAGSGATGAVLSGVVLNAAYFGLGRGLLQWLPATADMPVSYAGIFVVAVAVASAILTALYAFQQDSWRELLSFSSAENGAVAVAMLGVAMMFRQDGLNDLAGLAFVVGLVHLAGHTLGKGALFLAADTVYRHSHRYELVQNGVLGRLPLLAGLGALFAAMSLSAMPPMAGFASEWFVFQTVFQGFDLANLASRLVMVLAGAGLALTAAIALATFVKVYGIGLLGGTRGAAPSAQKVGGSVTAVAVLGVMVLILGVGMPVWLQALGMAVTANTGTNAAALMHEGWLLVPLTSKFAFISPSALVIALPLLALLPIGLLLVTRKPLRQAPVWYGGQSPDTRRTATTALAFSNALRTFYSFVYRPTEQTGRETAQEGNGHPYFIRRLTFSHDVAPVFGPHLFAPIERLVLAIAGRFRSLQSGHLNIYLAIIGGLLVIILAVSLFA
jgi:formate hydrogenlyase subunit 3/multisubunit Na+/H+ antiporter MnhD subunit